MGKDIINVTKFGIIIYLMTAFCSLELMPLLLAGATRFFFLFLWGCSTLIYFASKKENNKHE